MSVLETLQLFDKAVIGFLLEIHFKFTLNAFMTVKHVCVCVKIVIKIEIAKLIKEIAFFFFFCPYRTALVLGQRGHGLLVFILPMYAGGLLRRRVPYMRIRSA